MNKINNLENLYHSELKPKLLQLDSKRLLIKNKIIKYVLYSIIVLLVSLFPLLSPLISKAFPFLTIITFILCIVISVLNINPLWKNYHSQFKEQIIKQIINFIDKSLIYMPKQKISKNEFIKCNIFRHNIDRYNGDDYVEGKLEFTDVKFSEIHAEYMTTTTDSKGRTQVHWHTIFKGLLFSIDFNKNFKVKTYVLTDTAEKLFGFLGKKLQKMNKIRGELISLENTEFESEFAVYSEDQIESRYILTPSLMENILAFKKHTKKNIQLSFIDSRLYVAVPYSNDLFEPKLFGDIVDIKYINQYYNDLNLVLELVKTLNLNTRIWTKE